MTTPREDFAREIIQHLRKAGHLAYYVGGCVRDRLLGLDPRDYDIVTTATCAEIQSLFPKTVSIGAAFGTILVVLDSFQYEVSTFRGSAADSRTHATPRELLRTDAGHRDFTINAIVADPDTGEIFDYVGGHADLQHKVIRAVLNPYERFTEDPLRLARAVRFAVQLRFHLDSATEVAISRQATDVTLASPERLHQELLGILLSPTPDTGLRLLHRTGLLQALLPEVAAMENVPQPPEYHPEGDVWTHTLLMLREMGQGTPTPELALSVLLHDVGKPKTSCTGPSQAPISPTQPPTRRGEPLPPWDAPLPGRIADRSRFDRHPEVGVELVQNIATRYRWSRGQSERVCALVKDHLMFMNVHAMRRSTLLRWLRKPHFPELLELHHLDCLGSHGSLATYEFCREQLAALQPGQLRPSLLLTGEDLKELGYRPGPRYREILSALEDAQLEGALENAAAARDWVRQHYPICDGQSDGKPSEPSGSA